MADGRIWIVRMQDHEGRGPWRPGFSELWVEARADHVNLKPWPVEFGMALVKRARGYLGCGCRDIDQLRRWFTISEYRTLTIFGYRCVAMEVDTVLAESDTQCVFERRKPLRHGVRQITLYDGVAA